MKKKFIIALVLMGCFCTACSSNIPLDDSNTEVVAEYMAELLLRYGSDTPDKLANAQPTLKATVTPDVDITPTSKPTPTPTSKPTSKPTPTPVASNKANDKMKSLVAHTTPVKLDDIFGFKDVTINVKDGKEYSSYPENASAYSVTANEGHKLFIITLSAMNGSNKAVDFNLEKKGVTYYLYVNGKWYQSLTTILENDAQYLNVNLPKGKSSDFLVAFEIEENLNTKDAYLITLQGTNSCEIKLK